MRIKAWTSPVLLAYIIYFKIQKCKFLLHFASYMDQRTVCPTSILGHLWLRINGRNFFLTGFIGRFFVP